MTDQNTIAPELQRAARAICIDRGCDPDRLDVQGTPAWMSWVEVASVDRASLLREPDGTPLLTISRPDAERICNRLEFDASWDKVGPGYYTLKQQLQAA